MCPKCGKAAPEPDRSLCAPCNEKRRTADRARTAKRGAAGRPRYKDPQKARVYERERYRCCAAERIARERSKRRRHAKWRCTSCGEPSRGSSRCERCARRSYVRSGQHRGLPVWAPSYTVFEIATGDKLDTCDSLEEVALCLAFARLSEEDVEIVSDASVMSTFTSAEAWAPRRVAMNLHARTVIDRLAALRQPPGEQAPVRIGHPFGRASMAVAVEPAELASHARTGIALKRPLGGCGDRGTSRRVEAADARTLSAAVKERLLAIPLIWCSFPPRPHGRETIRCSRRSRGKGGSCRSRQ